MSEQSVKERRKNSRISLQLEAELELSNSSLFRGRIKNISFSGVYLSCATAKLIPAGETGFLRLMLKSGPNPSIITFFSQVIRTDESGVGMKLIDVDLNGYRKLKNIMVFNSSDPDNLLAELEKNPGLIIK